MYLEKKIRLDSRRFHMNRKIHSWTPKVRWKETRRTVQFGRIIRSFFGMKKKENSCPLFARKGIREQKSCSVLFVSRESYRL